MPKDALAANAAPMPDRRAALGALAAGALLAVPRFAKSASADSEILALSAEIVRRSAEAEAFQEAHINIHEERFQAIGEDRSIDPKARWEAACAFSRDSGRRAAILELFEFEQVTDKLFDRLMAVPATTQQGRAAKVRALLCHVLMREWRGPASDLEWQNDKTRALLGEFAGLTGDELEAI
jgi:hypothetical protein